MGITYICAWISRNKKLGMQYHQFHSIIILPIWSWYLTPLGYRTVRKLLIQLLNITRSDKQFHKSWVSVYIYMHVFRRGSPIPAKFWLRWLAGDKTLEEGPEVIKEEVCWAGRWVRLYHCSLGRSGGQTVAQGQRIQWEVSWYKYIYWFGGVYWSLLYMYQS